MAYANLVGQSCTNRADVFKRFRDFVCKRNGSYDYSATGIGWTLYDTYYASGNQNTVATNDYYVLFSAGESGTDSIYMKVLLKADYILVTGYLFWDSTGNTGTEMYGGTDNWYIINAAVPVLYIYGDMDAIFAIARDNSSSANYNAISFGRTVNTFYPTTTYTCAGALTAGSSVSIDIGAVPSTWAVGNKVFIRDNGNIEMVNIASKTASAIVVTTLANSYAAGSKLSAEVGYYCQNATGALTGAVSLLIDHTGAKNMGSLTWSANTALVGFGNPEILGSSHIVAPHYIGHGVYGYFGEMKNVYRRETAGMTALAVHALTAGGNGRAFSVNGITIFVKEV